MRRILYVLSAGILAWSFNPGSTQPDHGQPTPPERTQQYSGFIEEGPEWLLFFPANGGGQAWSIDQYRRAEGRKLLEPYYDYAERSRSEFAFCVKVEGRLSAEGSYGHLSLQKHELTIVRFIELPSKACGDVTIFDLDTPHAQVLRSMGYLQR